MTRRATFTQAELRRATKVAMELDRVVVIVGGEIRIVDPVAVSAVASTECDEASEIDKAFGCAT